jgi:precorrin-6A synthase
MIELVAIGIGTGNPDHLTLQAIREINAADLILIPRKGAGKTDLADLRRDICRQVLTNPAARIAEFDVPVRDGADSDYLGGVDAWHDAIARVWSETIRANLPADGVVALLVWGDPGLYDSTLRIAGRLGPVTRLRSIPALTSLNVLAAAHAIGLNDIGAPFLVTTGRRLRDFGWPEGVDTIVVMLDGACAFQQVDPHGVTIYWGAYLGMAEEILMSGPLAQTGPRIVAIRRAARARHGWIMDIYLLRRTSTRA